MSFCHSASISAIKIAATVATIVAFFLSLLHNFLGSKSLRHPWSLDAVENKSNHIHHLQLLCQSSSLQSPCIPCISNLPYIQMKERSAATNQEWRPDYPDQAIRVHTDSTLMGSFPCYSLFGHTNTYLYFYHMCFILSDLKCYGSVTPSSRNHLESAKEKK